MSTGEPLPTSGTSLDGATPHKVSPLAIISALLVILLFAGGAVAPLLPWITLRPAEGPVKGNASIEVTGFGKSTEKLRERTEEKHLSGSAAPQGLWMAIEAGVFAAVGLVSLVVLFLGLPRGTTQSVLRFATLAMMVGAILLLVWNILWLYKMKSFADYVNEKGGGVEFSIGFGLYAGVAAGALAAFAVMILANSSYERANAWMRFAEVGGVLLAGTLAFVVVPWDGEAFAKALGFMAPK